MKKMTSYYTALLCTFILCTYVFASCNDSGTDATAPCILSQSDSLEIYRIIKEKQPNIIFGKAKPQQFANTKGLFTTSLKPSEAWELVNNYKKNPIPFFQVKKFEESIPEPLVAFEIDHDLISLIKRESKIWGLRIYLGKQTDNPKDTNYTLVIIPTLQSGANRLVLNEIFDWNNPCPYNCPDDTDGRKFGDVGTTKPQP